MKRFLIGLAMLSIALSASGQGFSQSESYVEDLSKPNSNAPPMLGIHWARGFEPNFLVKHGAHAGGGHASPDMTYHSGNIMPTWSTESIFWGTSWGSYNGDEISGLDLWYEGFNNSNYAKTSDEYAGTGGQVGPTSSTVSAVHTIDTSAASGGNNSSAILAEVCKVITNPDPSGNGYYPVYTDLPRGRANYCAWHSWGSCGGVQVQFAFFWKLDGDPGCDPKSTITTESEGLATLANVSGHELSKGRTDPQGAGWWDSSGQENGDKCAWTFGAPYVTFSNGTIWKIQGEWSNNAYNTNTGYPNSLGQDGCLSGK